MIQAVPMLAGAMWLNAIGRVRWGESFLTLSVKDHFGVDRRLCAAVIVSP